MKNESQPKENQNLLTKTYGFHDGRSSISKVHTIAIASLLQEVGVVSVPPTLISSIDFLTRAVKVHFGHPSLFVNGQ